MIMSKEKDKEIEKLKEELEKLKKDAENYLNGWKRARADYLNLEREIRQEKFEWIKFANLELILKILPILDSFDQSLEKMPENLKNDQWVKGIMQIKRQFEDFLKDQGAEKIKTIGEKFDLGKHEVVEKRGEGNEIVEEIQSGYLLNGEVIRPAKVVIK